MRGAWFVLIAAILALAGCKNAGTKSGDTKSPGGVASRNKKDAKEALPTKAPTWLDDVGRLPGAGTNVPKGTSVTDPRDPQFDPKVAAQDVLAGRVLTPDGKPARSVFVGIELVGSASGQKAPFGITTGNDGYFFATGWKPGKTYELTVKATTPDGGQLIGVAQSKVPNPVLLIVLREDVPPPAGGNPPKGPDSGAFPPTPQPSDKVGDFIPPMGISPTTPKSSDGEWKPGGPITGRPPASIDENKPKPSPGGNGGMPSGGNTPNGGSAPSGASAPGSGAVPGSAIPPPGDLNDPPSNAKPIKPENVADGPKEFKPTVNIPGGSGSPPIPPLPNPPPNLPPKLPPSFTQPDGRSSMGTTTGNTNKLALVDTLQRPWSLDSVTPGSLVLVEFISSTCVPCKEATPVLKDLQRRYGANGVQVAAVLCDDLPQSQRIATAKKYSRDLNLNYSIFVEPGRAGSVRNSFHVESYPTALLLDSTGQILWSGHPGDKAKLESAIKQNLAK